MKPISQAFLQPTDKYWSFLHAMLSDEWAYKNNNMWINWCGRRC